jgi:hypothetical protein
VPYLFAGAHPGGKGTAVLQHPTNRNKEYIFCIHHDIKSSK